ncbi:MAG: S1C family serine protease [Rubrobacteraceae bacterium]
MFIFAAVIGTGIGGGDSVEIREAPTGNAPSVELGDEASVGELYDEHGPGVVSVDVASSDLGPGGGSGFVLDDEGYIVTNQHVLEGADDVSVRFASGERMRAEIVGEDPSTDVAVLEVDAPEGMLEPLTLGDSDEVEVGSPVIALGNPLNVGLSVTTGIVSGTERPIKAPNDYTIDDAVQTDAAISSGHSGGPLLDSRGAVIGINSQVAAGGSRGVAQGVGFAVPINTVKNVVEQIVTTGDVEHGYIGVRMFPFGIDEISAYTGLSKEELQNGHGLPENGAIVSEETSGGPADEAGIEGGEEEEIGGLPVDVGDVVTRVEGESVASPDDVIRVVNEKQPGETMTMTVVTPEEEPRQVEIEVAEQPAGGA